MRSCELNGASRQMDQSARKLGSVSPLVRNGALFIESELFSNKYRRVWACARLSERDNWFMIWLIGFGTNHFLSFSCLCYAQRCVCTIYYIVDLFKHSSCGILNVCPRALIISIRTHTHTEKERCPLKNSENSFHIFFGFLGDSDGIMWSAQKIAIYIHTNKIYMFS